MRNHYGRAAVLAAVCTVVLAATAMAADDAKTEPKAEKKAPSACVGLDIDACGTKGECFWRKQVTTKVGKTRRAHCRMRPYQQVAKKAA